jgi:hypothetical protein
MKTPVEQLFNESPDYTFLKVFGCACWPHTRPYNKRKLNFCSQKCVFLGYSSQHKGYKCLHIPSNRVYISRDVVFDENVFPFLPSTFVPVHTPHASSPTSIDQFTDIAHAPVLLSNHGAGTGRGAHLELLEEPSSPAADHVDQAGRLRCMGHAPLPVPASAPVPARTGACLPTTSEAA